MCVSLAHSSAVRLPFIGIPCGMGRWMKIRQMKTWKTVCDHNITEYEIIEYEPNEQRLYLLQVN